MKAFFVPIITLLVVLSFAACSAEHNDPWDEIPNRHISALAIGNGTMFIVLPDGSLHVWGTNVGFPRVSTQATDLFGITVGEDMSVAYISASGAGNFSGTFGQAMAITTDNALYGWGYSRRGEVGSGTHAWQPHPVRIMDGVSTVSTGNLVTMAITTDGVLYGWGDNIWGVLGTLDVQYSAVPIRLMDGITSVAVTRTHALAITGDGSLYGWGMSSALGIGVRFPAESDAEDVRLSDYVMPAPVRIMDGVTAVAVGGGFSLAICADGDLWSWGVNTNGQLGTGIFDNAPYPVRIKSNVADISVGGAGTHVAALTTDGGLYTWGRNNMGQLGNGTLDNQPTPMRIMDDVTHIFAGGFQSHANTAAVRSDGSVWAWGDNWFRQISNDAAMPYYKVPVPLYELTSP